MAKDYIVEEVRRIREEQAAKHAFDIKAILAAAKKRQAVTRDRPESPPRRKPRRPV